MAEVLILQHPHETGEAKGSARLLHLSLANSRIEVGETFDEQALQTLLRPPLRAQDALPAPAFERQPVLLYPAQADTPACTDEIPQDPRQVRLVVLDGTWRKSRKMLHLNPALQKLPRLPLTEVPQSNYLIRKAHRADQLSTLEAACLALAQIESAPGRYEPLLCAFDGFVAQQQSWIPIEHRR